MRINFLIIFFWVSLLMPSLSVLSQEVKSFHTDSTGKLFVNPGTPVYIYISTSPDGKNAVRLRSVQPEGEPLYWDGHGAHFLTHLNLYLGRKIRFDLYADGKPPKTTPNFDPKLGIQKGAIIYLSGTGTMELVARDENSGVNTIYYSINGSNPQVYTQPLVFDREGEFTLIFYAIDNVGNKEDAGERTVIVDTTPPNTTLEVEGPKHNNVYSARTRLILSASDAVGVSETLYSINNEKEIRYTRPIAMSSLPEGEHTIRWHSIDVVGNIEQIKELTFFVDKSPPMVFEEIVGNTYMVAGKEFSSGRSQLKIVAVDNKAGVKEIFYSINNEPFKHYGKPIFLSEITGAVTVRSYAIDNVDNKGVSDAEGQQFSMPEIDITGPSISYSFIGLKLLIRDTLWVSPKTKVSMTASDKGSGVNRIEYKLNDGSLQNYSEPFAIDKSGFYKASCTAWDNVDNLNVINFEFGVDANEPEIYHHFSITPHRFENDGGDRIPVFSSGVQLYLAATDDRVGISSITYSIDGLKEKPYSQPLNGFKKGQFTTIKLKATDRLGNQCEKSLMFFVE